jgi:hypothetical protein
MLGLESGESVPCVVLDLGMGGVQVSCHASVPEGVQANLTLNAPALWEPLVLPVRVAWARPEDEGRTIMGLQFMPQTGTQWLVLAELLRDHAQYY